MPANGRRDLIRRLKVNMRINFWTAAIYSKLLARMLVLGSGRYMWSSS